jgi:nascent polypeptide-associated complex subunit alpha
MFRLSPSELRRQLKRLGIKADIDVIDAEEVVVRRRDGKSLVISSPQVMLVRMQGTVMLQVVGSNIEEVKDEGEAAAAASFSEEDVKLVAEQAGVSLEEARRALEEAGGDIAAAIILLEERKKASGG